MAHRTVTDISDETHHMLSMGDRNPILQDYKRANELAVHFQDLSDRQKWRIAELERELAAAQATIADLRAKRNETMEGIADLLKQKEELIRLNASLQIDNNDLQANGPKVWTEIQRACGNLPDGYEVHIELENGAGGIVWYDDDSNQHVIDGSDLPFAAQIAQAIDEAIVSKRASNG